MNTFEKIKFDIKQKEEQDRKMKYFKTINKSDLKKFTIENNEAPDLMTNKEKRIEYEKKRKFREFKKEEERKEMRE